MVAAGGADPQSLTLLAKPLGIEATREGALPGRRQLIHMSRLLARRTDEHRGVSGRAAADDVRGPLAAVVRRGDGLSEPKWSGPCCAAPRRRRRQRGRAVPRSGPGRRARSGPPLAPSERTPILGWPPLRLRGTRRSRPRHDAFGARLEAAPGSTSAPLPWRRRHGLPGREQRRGDGPGAAPRRRARLQRPRRPLRDESARSSASATRGSRTPSPARDGGVDVVTSASGSSSSTGTGGTAPVTTHVNDLFVQPGLTVIVAYRRFFVALCAGALVVPGITYGPSPAPGDDVNLLLARRTAWFFPVSARYRKATFAPLRTDALGWMMTTSPTARPERISAASGPRCPTCTPRARRPARPAPRTSPSRALCRKSALSGTASPRASTRRDLDLAREPVARARATAPSGLRVETTFTPCSSTPSAEVFVKADGSTRRTFARRGASPPQWTIARAHPGADDDRVLRQRIDHQLERVADPPPRRAPCPPPPRPSLLRRTWSTCPWTGEVTSNCSDARAAGREAFERRPRLLDVVERDLLGEPSRGELGLSHGGVGRRLVELRGGDRAVDLASAVDLGERRGCAWSSAVSGRGSPWTRSACACQSRTRGAARRPAGRAGRGAGSAAEGGEPAPSRAPRRRPREIDAREGPGDGGRHRVALADAGAAVVHHLLLERRAHDARHVDVDRVRAQRERTPASEGGDEREGDDPEGPLHGSCLSREP